MRADAVVACDLFAGAGGFSLGAQSAGIHVAAAVEWDRHAAETYRRNLIDNQLFDAKLYEADISRLDPKRIRKEAFGEGAACDILLGGPPCQGFSTHRIKDAGVDDPRNGLLLRYFEYVRVLRPMFFVVENVPGLLWPRHEKYLAKFYSLARKADYEVLEPAIINARDFGVPQNRKRVFLLGYDRSRLEAPVSWPPAPTHVAPGTGSDLAEWVPAAVAFSGKVPKGDPNDIHMKHGSELVAAFRRTPPNGGSRRDSGRMLPCHKNHDGHKDVYGRIDPSVPGPTMTTACINPSKGRFVHPTEHHGISLRQAARLQSFPDWFVFSGGLIAGGVQVGNAVPVELARALLAPIKDAVVAVKKSERRAAA
ncbi:DNA cytosine methyltransferase [Hyphomonas sp.]|uniref:DNA cytosine methyltransferase n=1 Tax=Hyphomonas sp. TaxID=87 RepID=UPI0032EBBD35